MDRATEPCARAFTPRHNHSVPIRGYSLTDFFNRIALSVQLCEHTRVHLHTQKTPFPNLQQWQQVLTYPG